jgi:hypothetical protein
MFGAGSSVIFDNRLQKWKLGPAVDQRLATTAGQRRPRKGLLMKNQLLSDWLPVLLAAGLATLVAVGWKVPW